MTAGRPSVGLRVPKHDLCLAILERSGPLAATSANLSGLPAFVGQRRDGAMLPAADLWIDDGPTPLGAESTIIDVTGTIPRLVREGAISVTMLEQVLGPIERPERSATPPPGRHEPVGDARSHRPGRAVGAASLVTSLAAAAPEAGPGYALNHVAGFDHISTAKFDYNLNSGDFTIPGHFTATREGTDVTADRASGNSKEKMMHAEGNVVVHQTQADRKRQSERSHAAPSTLTCDKLDVDGTKKLYVATGNMHFTQEGGREALSDTAVLDDANHHLHMEGHVHVKNGEQTVDADVLDYDTVSGQLQGNGNVTISSPVETPTPGAPRSAGTEEAARALRTR